MGSIRKITASTTIDKSQLGILQVIDASTDVILTVTSDSTMSPLDTFYICNRSGSKYTVVGDKGVEVLTVGGSINNTKGSISAVTNTGANSWSFYGDLSEGSVVVTPPEPELPAAESKQINRQFAITEWGNKQWGKYCLPDNTTNKYPVIVFFHGVGETGSTEASLSKLNTHGIPWLLNSGVALEFENPKTKKKQRFISLALQDQYFSPELSRILFILQNDEILKNRVDLNNIFLTGLSAGGQMILNGVTTSSEISAKVKAIVPMSAASWTNRTDAQISYWKGKPTWAFHGKADKVAAYQNTEKFINSCGGKWTQLPSGHGDWNSIYTPNYKELIDGYNMNIYEWLASKVS